MKKVLLAVLVLVLFYSSVLAIEMVRQKNVATYIYFPIADADGDFVHAGIGLDSEIETWSDGSPPAGGFSDCTNEAIHLDGGWYYLSLTQGEMNADYIAIQCSSTTVGAKKQAILIRTIVGDPLYLATTTCGTAVDTFAIKTDGGAVADVTLTATTTDVTNAVTVIGTPEVDVTKWKGSTAAAVVTSGIPVVQAGYWGVVESEPVKALDVGAYVVPVVNVDSTTSGAGVGETGADATELTAMVATANWSLDISAYSGAKAGTYLKNLYDNQSNWATATGFAVAGDAMTLTTAERKAIADSVWLADSSQYSSDDDSTMAGIAWRNKNLYDNQDWNVWDDATRKLTHFSEHDVIIHLDSTLMIGVNVASVDADAIEAGDFKTDAIDADAIADDAIDAGAIKDDAIDYATFAATAPGAWWPEGKTGYALSAAGVDAVWDEDTTGHVTAQSFAKMLKDTTAYQGAASALTAAGIADAVWDEDSSGHNTAQSYSVMLKDTSAFQGAASGLTALAIWEYDLVGEHFDGDSTQAGDYTRVAAACGSGIGARAVTVTIQNAADSVAISGFGVEVYDSSSSEFKGSLTTSNNGIATFSLDDETYLFHFQKTPWSITTPWMAVIAANKDTTIYATAFDAGDPASADMCRIYINDVRDMGAIEQEGCELRAYIPEKYHPVTVGEAIRIPRIAAATSDASGYVYLDVYRSAGLTAGDGTSTVLYDLELLDEDGEQVVRRRNVEIPDQANWEISWTAD